MKIEEFSLYLCFTHWKIQNWCYLDFCVVIQKRIIHKTAKILVKLISFAVQNRRKMLSNITLSCFISEHNGKGVKNNDLVVKLNFYIFSIKWLTNVDKTFIVYFGLSPLEYEKKVFLRVECHPPFFNKRVGTKSDLHED